MGLKFGWGGVSEKHLNRTVLARLKETQILQPPVSVSGELEGLTKEQCILPALLSGRKLDRPEGRQLSFLPLPICLPQCRSSEQVSLTVSNSMHWAFKKNTEVLGQDLQAK